MLKIERDQFALQAVTSFVALTGINALTDALYINALKKKIALVMAVVDQAARGITQPLFVQDAVPGYDVLVYQSNLPQEDEPLDIPVEASTGMDPLHLDALKMIMDQAFSGKGEGVFMHEAGDGMHYVVFLASRREEVLTELGFDFNEMSIPGARPTGTALH